MYGGYAAPILSPTSHLSDSFICCSPCVTVWSCRCFTPPCAWRFISASPEFHCCHMKNKTLEASFNSFTLRLYTSSLDGLVPISEKRKKSSVHHQFCHQIFWYLFIVALCHSPSFTLSLNPSLIMSIFWCALFHQRTDMHRTKQTKQMVFS